MTGFKSLKPQDLSDNVFDLLAKEWALVAAGNQHSYNMMTAAWGGFGWLWNKTVSYIFIRQSRYTVEFIEKSDTFSLNFFGEGCRDSLQICGQKSGRDFDKMKEIPLTPFSFDDNGIAFNEARLIMNCKKMAVADVRNFDFIDKSVLQFYEDNDYHNLYICEIKDVLIKE